jgi:hypothetical protein
MRYISERSTDPGLLVLAGLAEGPKHGCAITQDVEQLAVLGRVVEAGMKRLRAAGATTRVPALARPALALHPLAYRRRYGEEMAGLLCWVLSSARTMPASGEHGGRRRGGAGVPEGGS